jgi:cell division protein FtsB
MDQLWTAIITTACTVAVSLLVTYFFNKISGVPKKISDEKKAREQKMTCLEQKNAALETKVETLTTELSTRLTAVEEAVSHYPEYRAQSLCIQQQLQEADTGILDVCKAIKDDVVANREMLDSRLKSLENREKNALREKIYHLWRTFTDLNLNPMQAWTDMERHSFNELVRDYESLGGNDYVHKVIIPAMARLNVVYMDDLDAVKELFESRNVRHAPATTN